MITASLRAQKYETKLDKNHKLYDYDARKNFAQIEKYVGDVQSMSANLSLFDIYKNHECSRFTCADDSERRTLLYYEVAEILNNNIQLRKDKRFTALIVAQNNCKFDCAQFTGHVKYMISEKHRAIKLNLLTKILLDDEKIGKSLSALMFKEMQTYGKNYDAITFHISAQDELLYAIALALDYMATGGILIIRIPIIICPQSMSIIQLLTRYFDAITIAHTECAEEDYIIARSYKGRLSNRNNYRFMSELENNMHKSLFNELTVDEQIMQYFGAVCQWRLTYYYYLVNKPSGAECGPVYNSAHNIRPTWFDRTKIRHHT